MPHATKRTFLSEIARHGATYEDVGCRGISINIDAPPTRVWASTGSHCITCSSHPGNGALNAVYAELITDMRDGTEPCTDPTCEYCHPVPDHLIGTVAD